MYKVRNCYKECHLMDLNMMDIAQYKRAGFSATEIALTCMPLLLIAGILCYAIAPELGFYAECQNIPGGDICSISLK